MVYAYMSADFVFFSNLSGAPYKGHQLGLKCKQNSLDPVRHLLVNLCTNINFYFFSQ